MNALFKAAVLLVATPVLGLAQVDTSAIELFETLNEVDVARDPGVSLSKKSIVGQELISEVELRKAACCDLSESFETNASISASFTDAVTGTRQIKLLGLEGPYAMYTRGNLATMGGLSSVLGLGFIPGAWIQSIQLSKGPGSVVNGASAISGQINYELRPSFTKQVAHINLFAGPGRFEQNAIVTWHRGKNLSSNLMVHGRQQLFRWDNNNDGYLDAPLSNHFFIQNAWKVTGARSEGQLGVKFSSSDNIGGSTLYGQPTLVPIWSHELQTDKIELWAKRGYFFDSGINRSLGTQFSAIYQDLDSYFGNLSFTAKETKYYGNLIAQDNIIDTRNTVKLGMDLSVQDLEQHIWNQDGSFTAIQSGVYGEYSFVSSPDGQGLSLILGQRLDRFSLTGRDPMWFYVPRLHVKYNINELALRAQASRSYRHVILGADYMGFMANSRGVLLPTFPTSPVSSAVLAPIESSWTLGGSVAYTPEVAFKELTVTADAFLTKFDRKLVLDLDEAEDTMTFVYQEWSVSDFSSQPYALSLQVGAQYELFHRTQAKFAYRYQQARQFNGSAFLATQERGLEEVILNVPHLIYTGFSYSGKGGLGIELNATYNSSQRLPEVGYDGTRSPAFTMLGGQVSKELKKYGQFYVGLQNALNVRQLNPVLGGNAPFDGRFDASVVWGPIMGRQLYAGWRYDLRKE